MATAEVKTPLGVIGIAASEHGIVEVSLNGPVMDVDSGGAQNEHRAEAVVQRAAAQFAEYFSGERREFDLPLDNEVIEGASFRSRVLTAMLQVGYGEVVTYGELAEMAGSPRAARAAGTACSTNPLAIIIPCHRVVPAGGGVGSYGGGEEMKKWLLELEGSVTPSS